MKKAVNVIKAVEKAEAEFAARVPWSVKRTGMNPTLFGSQISLSDNGDFLTLEEAREVASWLANELGGRLIWDTKERK
jgi:hypothetical protein